MRVIKLCHGFFSIPISLLTESRKFYLIYRIFLDILGKIFIMRSIQEIMQEITLMGLWRAKFFEYAAIYGDTALRILNGLNRFSEDLDFHYWIETPRSICFLI